LIQVQKESPLAALYDNAEQALMNEIATSPPGKIHPGESESDSEYSSEDTNSETDADNECAAPAGLNVTAVTRRIEAARIKVSGCQVL
jgi:hypothetical protein